MKQIVTITGENLNVVMNNAEANATAPKQTKAQMRIAALKAAGVDVSNYFTMGDEQVVKAVGGAIVPVTDDVQIDAVGKKIVDGGYISNWSLFRRWVMAQMFHYLREMEKGRGNFNELLQRHGYEYQWSMLERELNAQAKMFRNGDMENFRMRNHWFNGEVAGNMALDYIEALQDYIDNELTYRINGSGKHYKHTCKGTPYVKLQNRDIFLSDLGKKVYMPLRQMAYDMINATSISSLLNIVRRFNAERKHLYWATKQSNAFIYAYKGSGAYFTMRNLIMFHGAKFRTADGYAMSREQSLNLVYDAAKTNVGEGWKMMGVLKRLIKDSGISIQGKIDEWKK